MDKFLVWGNFDEYIAFEDTEQEAYLTYDSYPLNADGLPISKYTFGDTKNIQDDYGLPDADLLHLPLETIDKFYPIDDIESQFISTSEPEYNDYIINNIYNQSLVHKTENHIDNNTYKSENKDIISNNTTEDNKIKTIPNSEEEPPKVKINPDLEEEQISKVKLSSDFNEQEEPSQVKFKSNLEEDQSIPKVTVSSDLEEEQIPKVKLSSDFNEQEEHSQVKFKSNLEEDKSIPKVTVSSDLEEKQIPKVKLSSDFNEQEEFDLQDNIRTEPNKRYKKTKHQPLISNEIEEVIIQKIDANIKQILKQKNSKDEIKETSFEYKYVNKDKDEELLAQSIQYQKQLDDLEKRLDNRINSIYKEHDNNIKRVANEYTEFLNH